MISVVSTFLLSVLFVLLPSVYATREYGLSDARGFDLRILEQFSLTNNTRVGLEPNYFGFFPSLVVFLRENTTISYVDSVFNYTFTPHLNSNHQIILDVDTVAISRDIRITLVFFFPSRLVPHVFETGGNQQIVFKDLTENDLADYNTTGIRVFRCNESLEQTVFDLVKTVKMFLSFFNGHFDAVSEEESVKFLNQVIGINYEKRVNWTVPITESDIHSGDVFATLKFDGLDPLIMATTGSRIGHVQIAVEINGTMNICEAQAGFYWPIRGWQCNPFKDSVEMAKKAQFNSVHLRLAKPYRDKFDPAKAYEFLKPRLGTRFGFESFIFGAMDTRNENYFSPLDEGSLDLLYYFVDVIAPRFGHLVAGEALCNRLEMKCRPKPSREDLYGEMGRRGMRFSDAYVKPELDSYRYGKDKHMSRTCSALVVEILRQSGAFEGTNFDVDFEVAEQTPGDVTQMRIWDTNSPLPSKCVEQDPSLPYCQLMGDYRIDLAHSFNTIPPHPHMSETCTTVAPLFEREIYC